jgi:DNA repair photolyase
MPSLFPRSEPSQPLVGIARLASEGRALADGHQVEYSTLENRTLLARCYSRRVPFAWMINPYRGCEFGCRYCYARYTHEFMELREERDFERKIYVKQHTGHVLRRELKKVRAGEDIAIGTATDPYQPAERKFGVTRAILEELALHRGLGLGLVTKSCLILRDLDVLRSIAENNRLTICVTITTLKTDLARLLEPRAPRPDLRLQTVKQLVDGGIRAGINCAPVLPGITDAPADLEALAKAAAAVGAAFVFANPLFLKPCTEKIFTPFLEQHFPQLVPAYKKRFSGKAFLPREYQQRIALLMKKFREKWGVGERFAQIKGEFPSHTAPSATQLALFP